MSKKTSYASLKDYKKTIVSYSLRNTKEHDMVKDLLPKDKERAHLVIQGPLCIPVTNSLRRCIISEIPLYILTADEIFTDEDFTSDWLRNRLELIPLEQIPELNKISYSLEIINDEMDIKYVTSKDLGIKVGNKAISVCDLYNLAFLSNGKTVRFTNIHCEKRYGYQPDCAQSGATIVYYSHSDDEMEAELSYITNGTLSASDVLATACEELVIRLRNVKEFLAGDINDTDFYNYFSHGDEHKLTVRGESHTIANLLLTSLYETDKSITFATYALTHETERNFVLEWVHSSGKKILINAIDPLVAIYESIGAAK